MLAGTFPRPRYIDAEDKAIPDLLRIPHTRKTVESTIDEL
jgi:hypothetical protein